MLDVHSFSFFLQLEKMKAAKGKMEEHNQFVADERKFVNHQRFLANCADDGFYMEIDGMDQSKTNLPHFPNMPKNVSKDLLMQMHVTRVRYSDGRPNDIYVLVYKHICPRFSLYLHNHLHEPH